MNISRAKLTAYCVALGLEYSISEKIFLLAGLYFDGYNPNFAPYQCVLEMYAGYYYDVKEKGVFPKKSAKDLITEVETCFSVKKYTAV